MLSAEAVRQILSRLYGFRMPLPLAKVVQKALAAASLNFEEDIDVGDFIHQYGFMFSFTGPVLDIILEISGHYDPNLKFEAFLPELFHFGYTGNQKQFIGYLIHAPELESEDYPIVEWMDNTEYPGAVALGEDSSDSFEYLMARTLLSWKQKGLVTSVSNVSREEEKRVIMAMAAVLSVTPGTAKGNRELKPYIPEIPAGYHFEMTPDGIGVLAPKESFADIDTKSFLASAAFESSPIKEIEIMLKTGAPATALIGIRHLMRGNYYNSIVREAVAPIWKEVYMALNRPLLSKRILS